MVRSGAPVWSSFSDIRLGLLRTSHFSLSSYFHPLERVERVEPLPLSSASHVHYLWTKYPGTFSSTAPLHSTPLHYCTPYSAMSESPQQHYSVLRTLLYPHNLHPAVGKEG